MKQLSTHLLSEIEQLEDQIHYTTKKVGVQLDLFYSYKIVKDDKISIECKIAAKTLGKEFLRTLIKTTYVERDGVFVFKKYIEEDLLRNRSKETIFEPREERFVTTKESEKKMTTIGSLNLEGPIENIFDPLGAVLCLRAQPKHHFLPASLKVISGVKIVNLGLQANEDRAELAEKEQRISMLALNESVSKNFMSFLSDKYSIWISKSSGAIKEIALNIPIIGSVSIKAE